MVNASNLPFAFFSLQYDMIDNLTLPDLPSDLLRPTVAIVFGTLVRGPCLNGLPFLRYLLYTISGAACTEHFFLNLLEYFILVPFRRL